MSLSEKCRQMLINALGSIGEQRSNFPGISEEAHAHAMASVFQQLNENAPKLSDKVAELYVNSLISGVATPVVNFLSIFRMPVDIMAKFGEATFATLARSGGLSDWANAHKAASFSDALEFTKGSFAAWSALDEFWRFGKQGFLAGKNLDTGMDQAGTGAIGGGRLNWSGDFVESSSIEKAIGKVVRLPTAVGVGADEFMKAYYRRVKMYELISQAQSSFSDDYIKGLGFTRDELVHKLRAILTNPFAKKGNDEWMRKLNEISPDLVKQVTDFAHHQTFQEEPPGIIKWVMSKRDSHPLIWGTVIPFVRTPYNIGKQAVEYIPAVAQMAKAVERLPNKAIRLNFKNVSPADWGRGLLGTAAMWTAWKGIEDGTITLGYSDNASIREGQQAAGIPEYSIRIGDEWVEWGRVEPFASWLIAVGEARQKVKDLAADPNVPKESLADRIALTTEGVAHGFTKGVLNRQFLYGLANFLEGVMGNEGKVSNFGRNIAGNIVAPPALAQFARSQDPYARKVDSVGSYIQNRVPSIPGVTDKLGIPTRQDLPIEYKAFGGEKENIRHGLSAWIPLFSNAKNKTELQDLAADINLKVMPVGKTIQGVRLTPEQQSRYDQLSSEFATDLLEKNLKDLKDLQISNARKEKIISNIINKARQAAAGKAMGEFMKTDPEFYKKLVTAKLARKGMTLEEYNEQ